MKSILGAISLALGLTIASCEPAHAVTVENQCVSKEQITAVDQEAMNADPDLAGYQAIVVAQLNGDAAKNAAQILASLGAPDYILAADTIVILNAAPPVRERADGQSPYRCLQGRLQDRRRVHPQGDRGAVGGDAGLA